MFRFKLGEVTPPKKINMTMENPHFLMGDTSSNGWFFQPVMLVFRGVLAGMHFEEDDVSSRFWR